MTYLKNKKLLVPHSSLAVAFFLSPSSSGMCFERGVYSFLFTVSLEQFQLDFFIQYFT